MEVPVPSLLYIFLSALVVTVFKFSGSSSVALQVEQGEILGQEGQSRQGRSFQKFLGIPYGVVPHRFGDSQRAAPWNGVFNANKFGNDCTVSEDCLYLNVYTPMLDDKKFPVLFWIHGGAFQYGSGESYAPDYFMDEDVVVVTINYRLGTFGFFNLDVDGAPGNQGLKDMIRALEWTQDNIGFFGGDKDSVTIFGESAGGAAVSFLILSPLSKGLFHRAISQSGTALCPWAFRTDVKSASLEIAEQLGCTGMELEILGCMRNLTYEQVSGARRSGFVMNSFVTPMNFVPTVERRADSSSGRRSRIFLGKTPLEMAESGEFMDVPYVLGINKFEAGVGGLFLNWFSNKTVRDWIPVFAPRALGYLGRADAWNISHEIQRLYFELESDSEGIISKLITDRTFLAPTRLSALLHSKKRSPTFVYSFDKPGVSALVPLLTLNTPQHADELMYLWILSKPPYWGSQTILPGSPDYSFSRDFVHSWAEFARTGRATWRSSSRPWEPFTPQGPSWFHMKDVPAAVMEDPRFARKMNFWNEL